MTKPYGQYIPDVPWWTRAKTTITCYIWWPFAVRMLKRNGFHRTGWMTWESDDHG